MTHRFPKPANWDGFFAALDGADVPEDFLSEEERDQGMQDRDPFEGWREDDVMGEPPVQVDRLS